MKAVEIHEYGGPEELVYEDAPKPTILPDEVLVKVYASGVNPIDWKVRRGVRKEQRKDHLPLILGWDMSGVIEEIGANVKNFKKGNEVYGRPDTSRNGTYAEYVAVRASEIALKPVTLNHIEAAGVALAGLTAWQGLFDNGHLQPEQKILITGAAGGVGTYAVQFAKWRGAYVIGTASEGHVDFLKELGADLVLDYHKHNFEKNLGNLDVILDTIGGKEQVKLAATLKKGGILVSTVGIVDKEALKEMGVEGIHFFAQSLPDQLQQIAHLIDTGKIKPIVAKVFPLREAGKAQQLSEEGHTVGKIVLQVV